MSRSLLFWLLLILWFILGWWLCKTYLCGASDNVTAAAAAAPIIAANDECDVSLNMRDGSAFNISANRNIRFLKSSFDNLPLSTNTENALQTVVDYLSNNPERSLTLSGKYNAEESYSGILPNLGIARATTVKNILVGLGASSTQLEVEGDIDNDLCYSEDTRSNIGNGATDAAGGTGAGGTEVTGAGSGSGSGAGSNLVGRLDTINNGMGFSFRNASSGDARLAAIKDRLFGKPITLYFETNAAKLSVTNQQRQDFADLSYYLDKVPDASLTIDGHTDNRGADKLNERLSKGRAEFVRKYITRNAGINDTKMTAQGYGPSRPVGSNDTREGRAKNRRVEVILK